MYIILFTKVMRISQYKQTVQQTLLTAFSNCTPAWPCGCPHDMGHPLDIVPAFGLSFSCPAFSAPPAKRPGANSGRGETASYQTLQ